MIINITVKYKIMELIQDYGIICPLERGVMFKHVYADAFKYGIADMRTLRELVRERIRAGVADVTTDWANDI